MAELGIHTADIGLPGAGPRAFADVRALAREIAEQRLSIAANCAARTVVADVEPIARISQEVGIAIEACTFIGSSPIRQYAEDWTLEKMLRVSAEAIRFAVGEGLPVMYVTEDTTRARPETLEQLYTNAIECGARRLCLADTVGHATPSGVRELVRFIRAEVIGPTGLDIKIDWHGHRDRGFGLANTFAAIEAGVDRVHGTALGIGERIGKPDLSYVQFPYSDFAASLVQMGVSSNVANLYAEMARAVNERRVKSREGRRSENTTPTRFEAFADTLAHG